MSDTNLVFDSALALFKEKATVSEPKLVKNPEGGVVSDTITVKLDGENYRQFMASNGVPVEMQELAFNVNDQFLKSCGQHAINTLIANKDKFEEPTKARVVVKVVGNKNGDNFETTAHSQYVTANPKTKERIVHHGKVFVDVDTKHKVQQDQAQIWEQQIKTAMFK